VAHARGTCARGLSTRGATAATRSCRQGPLFKSRVFAALALALAANACTGWRLKGSNSPAGEAVQERELTVKPLEPRKGLAPTATNEPGAVFLLDGKPMCFHGSNNYYLIFKNEAMIDSVFGNSKKIGLNVFRHWGHLDRGSLDGKVPHLEDDGTKEGVYFQYWDTKTNAPAYNEGPDGLQRLDLMMAKARQYGIRIVLTLTNNWPDFGGMDQYLLWYGLDEHPRFYTDERVKKAYKDWVAYLINRTNTVTGVPYKDDPYIFAWELANEPRIRNYSAFDSPGQGFDKSTVTAWAKEMAEHIRAIDPQHMIAVGDEGFFWREGGPGDFYAGADGIDHDALLAIPDIDYGTYHLYPDHWATGTIWGDQWIVDHLDAARDAGKPTVLEEYGIVVTRDDQTKEILKGWDRRERTYRRWNDIILLGGGAGSMYWMQAGYDDYLKRDYTDYDHFTVYAPETDPTARLLQDYAERFPTDAQVCQLASAMAPVAKRQIAAGFITVSTPPSEWPAVLTTPASAAVSDETVSEASAPAPAAPSPAPAAPVAPAPAQPESQSTPDFTLEQIEDWARSDARPL
jgi:mannan endo-1,4-beta-mannosidase